MTENKRRHRGPYGRHKYDFAIDHGEVGRMWYNKMTSESETETGGKKNRDKNVMNTDSATESFDPVTDDINEMIRCTDYDLKDEDLMDSDTDYEELDFPQDSVFDDVDESNDSDNRPLFPGSSVTIGSFMLILALYTTKYNLIGEATQQLLNIHSLILPSGNILCNTLHEFKKFFRNLKNPLINHYICTYCSGLIENASVKNCPYEACGKVFDKKSGNYFLEMPLKNQIRNMFRQENFFENLQHRFEKKVQPGNYSDI